MHSKKVKACSGLAKILSALRKNGKKIVFTNGCFDILHVGHIRYLEKAKRLGDILVIGLNSDESIRRIKGSARPLNSQSDRAEMLAALPFVDYISIFGEPTPEALIKKLKPDILVKGGDWKEKEIAGGAFVRSYGGRVIMIEFVKGYSTTALIERMNPVRKFTKRVTHD